MRLDFVVHHHNYTIDPEIRYQGLLLLLVFFVYIYFHDINICKNLPQKQNYLVKKPVSGNSNLVSEYKLVLLYTLTDQKSST